MNARRVWLLAVVVVVVALVLLGAVSCAASAAVWHAPTLNGYWGGV